MDAWQSGKQAKKILLDNRKYPGINLPPNTLPPRTSTPRHSKHVNFGCLFTANLIHVGQETRDSDVSCDLFAIHNSKLQPR